MISKKYIQKLCVCGILSALYFALEFLSQELSQIVAGRIELPLSSLPLILAAVLFGPIWGGAVGLIGGFLSQAFSQYGLMVTTPIWIAPAVIQGIVMGVLFYCFKKRCDFQTLFFEILCSSIVLTFLNSVALYCDGLINHYTSTVFSVTLAIRICFGIAASIIFAILTPPIVNTVKKNLP